MQLLINLRHSEQREGVLGLHRSGWAYVIDVLDELQSDEGILCDTFVDKTFLFSSSTVVPYEVPWIGFIHHPFDGTHTSHSGESLLSKPAFQASLKTCKGLIVFGEQLKGRWTAALKAFMTKPVPVVSLVHPTEEPELKFSMDRFNSNQDKALIQVGAHLRDTYAIFQLNEGKSPVGDLSLEKKALVGPYMDAYYIAEDFFSYLVYSENVPHDSHPETEADPAIPTEEMKRLSINGELPTILTETERLSPTVTRALSRSDVACRDSFNNKYLVGALRVLKRYDESVSLIPTLDDRSYDELLSQNVIFLNLVAATTGVNTIIEAIVRTTPIVVNRLPSTLELLGAEYPLLYDELEEVPELLTQANIERAHRYLNETMNKTLFTGSYFLGEFKEVLSSWMA